MPDPEPAAANQGFDAVYRAHAQTVARWAARLGGPAIDVEDVTQEVFLIVHRQLASYRGDARITTWLYRITANVVRWRRRKERWRRWLGGSADEVAGDVAAPSPAPDEALARRQAERTLYRALDGLAPKYREALVLFEIEGLSGDEIAEMMGARPATVWVWLHRARAQLLERLEAER